MKLRNNASLIIEDVDQSMTIVGEAGWLVLVNGCEQVTTVVLLASMTANPGV